MIEVVGVKKKFRRKKVLDNITFNVTKDDKGNYKVNDLSNSDLEKIHGVYNYDKGKFQNPLLHLIEVLHLLLLLYKKFH